MDGRVAIVTGGGLGIGAAICRALAAEGAIVYAADIAIDEARQLALGTEGVHAVEMDVTDATAVDTVTSRIAEEHGRLDVMINNAGSDTREEYSRLLPRFEAQRAEAAEGRVRTPLRATVTLTDEQWRRMMASHLDGTFHCTRAALRTMGPQGSGAIVNISSVCGLSGCAGAPHYSAAKAAILGFTRAVAKEVITQGIRVNAVAPGWIDTPRLDYLSDEVRRLRTAQTPAARFGTAEEVAATVAFLVSDDASYFVGETLSPNGGLVTI